MAARKQCARSSGASCAVHGCNNNQRKVNDLLDQPCFDHTPKKRSECPCKPPYRLHRMPPNDPELKRQWLAALNRKHPPENVFVCSFHFVDRTPTEQNPVPELYLGFQRKVAKKRRVIVRCTADEGACTEASEECILGSRKRKLSTTSHLSPAKQLIQDASESSHSETEDITEMPSTSNSNLTAAAPNTRLATFVDASTQWIDFHLQCHDYSKPWLKAQDQVQDKSKKKEGSARKTKDAIIQCQISEDLGVVDILVSTDSDAKLYAGIPYLAFLTLVACLSKEANGKFKMPVADQILMTLMKLKLNLLYADLARRFSVSESLVSKTVSYWVDTLGVHLTRLIVWLPREIIRATMPGCFRHYPKTTCILDCAETIMQKARNLRSRGESYSKYKSHNTVKYCVAIAPCGLIMHISNAYGGRANDRFIVQDSGMLDRLLPGDEVMAGRGFTIQDLLFPRRVSLNIPAFSQNKQLPDQEVARTRRIATVRIHVELAIRRLKVFRILKETVPVSMTKEINKILRICAALVNLGGELIQNRLGGE